MQMLPDTYRIDSFINKLFPFYFDDKFVQQSVCLYLKKFFSYYYYFGV